MKIAILGATGCVGSNLLRKLSDSEDQIIAFYRNKKGDEYKNVAWIKYDLSKDKDLEEYLDGLDLVYYFIHSLDKKRFVEKELEYASKTNEACVIAGVKRVIYLGGIQNDDKESSAHMKSRKETGERLAENGLNVWEFRASIVLGSCSVSFQIAEDLARKLPIMVVPKWLKSKCSPIYIEDLIDVLNKAKSLEYTGHKITNIGTGEITYEDLLVTIRSDHFGKETKVLSSPFIALQGSALWIWLVTGVDFDLAWHLTDSLIHDTSTDDTELRDLLGRQPVAMEDAIHMLVQK